MTIPKKYYIWLGIGLLLMIFVEFTKDQEINWNYTYSVRDEIPFGSHILYNLLNNGAWKDSIEISNQSFYERYQNDSTHYSCIFYANNIDFDNESLSKLVNHIAKGNVAFFIGNHFSENLLDTFNLTKEYRLLQTKGDSISIPSEKVTFIDSTGKFFNHKWRLNLTYEDSALQIKPMGFQNTYPNFVSVHMGKGTAYFHCFPNAFSNYYLINDISFAYANKVISYIPNGKIVWDDFMNYGYRKPPSEMRIFLSSLPMRTGYQILTFVLLLNLIFAWRRKQRIIPVIEPIKNSTHEFIQILTNLYLSNKNNNIIANYLIRSFQIKTKEKYLINWNKSTHHIVDHLAHKSGKPLLEVKSILTQCAKYENRKHISQNELIQLNKTIENFLNKS
jgi:hypothetical protein